MAGVGFFSLEEIDESQYGLEIAKPETEDKREKSKVTVQSKKRKRGNGDGGSDDAAEIGNGMKVDGEAKLENVKKKKRRKKKKKKKAKSVEGNVESVPENAVANNVESMAG